MQYQYRPSGVCSRQITIDVENGVVQKCIVCRRM